MPLRGKLIYILLYPILSKPTLMDKHQGKKMFSASGSDATKKKH